MLAALEEVSHLSLLFNLQVCVVPKSTGREDDDLKGGS